MGIDDRNIRKVTNNNVPYLKHATTDCTWMLDDAYSLKIGTFIKWNKNATYGHVNKISSTRICQFPVNSVMRNWIYFDFAH